MNQLDTASLLWGLLFGSIGVAYFMYGRKQQRVVPLAAGIALMVIPYFVSNIWLMVGLCLLLLGLPKLIKL